MDSNGHTIEEDPKSNISTSFNDLCRLAVKISSKAAGNDEASTFLTKKLVELSVEIDKIVSKRSSILSQQDNNETNANVENDVLQGLRKKEGVSRVKGCPKSCLEKKSKRKQH